ncbi:MAG: AsmA-like C-terminal region-containing protein, partial [Candidatus Omnitrophica bacterium]|nr:AsmA-like C-terminal region-containing protein [Candidatus Omnitrophota bacterium]
KGISLGVDVLGYIFHKKVSISGILIDSPNVQLIRQKDGTLNVQSLAKPTAPGAGKAAAPLAIPALLISSLKAERGALAYIDRSFAPALSLDISDLSFSVSKISLTDSFPFVLEGAVLSAKKNIWLEGKAQVDLKANTVTISELKGATDLSDILLEKIPVSFPMAKDAPLPTSLKGKLGVVVNKLTVGPQGLLALRADALLANGGLEFKELASPVKDIGMNVKITENKISFDKVSAAIGWGLIKGSAAIDDYLSRQDFSISAEAHNLKIEELINQDKSQVKAEGLASGKIRLKGAGFNPQALASTLSGDAEISITQAKLKNINVLRTMLDKISVIPGLAQKVADGLPERYKQKLAEKDTFLSDIKLPLTIENSRLIIQETTLGADEFLFKGRGQAGFEGAYALEGSFLIPQELSAAMVAQVSQLQYLLNDDKQIYIPLKISGRALAFKFIVDAEYLTRKLLVDQAKQQLFKVIDKAIGTKKADTAGEDTTGDTTGQDAPSTEEIIGSILDKIFKK